MNHSFRTFTNEFLVGKITQVTREFKLTATTYLREFNLTVESFNLLRILNKLPDSKCSLSEMKEMDLMESTVLLKTIKHLEAEGLIKKHTAKELSENEISLTAKGSKTLQRIKNYETLMNNTLAGLDAVEKKTLYNLLNKVQTPLVLQVM